MRLGECFYTLLHHEEELPATHGQPLLLRRIVCSRLGCFAELAPGELRLDVGLAGLNARSPER